MSYVLAGVCPQCGGTHTEIALLDERRSQALCHDCGFKDDVISCDDLDLAVETSKRAFSIVRVGGGKDEMESIALDDVAATFAAVVSVICHGMSCDKCPLVKDDDMEASEWSDPSGLASLTPLGICCLDMNVDNGRNRLAKLLRKRARERAERERDEMEFEF